MSVIIIITSAPSPFSCPLLPSHCVPPQGPTHCSWTPAPSLQGALAHRGLLVRPQGWWPFSEPLETEAAFEAQRDVFLRRSNSHHLLYGQTS